MPKKTFNFGHPKNKKKNKNKPTPPPPPDDGAKRDEEEKTGMEDKEDQGGNSIEKSWLENGSRFNFDSVSCLNYPFLN